MERMEWSTDQASEFYWKQDNRCKMKDQEDDDAIELINCVYKFTMCRLQDTIRDPGFLL